MPSSLRHSFEHQLAELQDDILRMGSFVSGMLGLAMEALVRQDLNLAERVVEMDDTADAMDLQIEQKCMRLLALQQPMSRDLRIIGAGLKIITDLERIGDYSVDMAKTARRLARDPYYHSLQDLAKMGAEVEWMVRECIHAYVDHDLDLVEQVIVRDDVVDDAYDRMFSQLLVTMEREPCTLRQGTWLLHVGRFLERIADHAVNVAEKVHYVEIGERREKTPPKPAHLNGHGRPTAPYPPSPHADRNGH